MKLRCPFCRSVDTSWNEKNALTCSACGRRVEPAKHDAAPNYEHADWAWRASTWSAFVATGRFVRLYGDGDNVLGAEGEKLDEIIAKRAAPLEINDVRRIFAGAISRNPSPVDVEIIGALALLLWGAKPTLGRSWYRRDPKRSPFATLGEALRFHAGLLGVSAGGWRSSVDGPRLEIAETRRARVARRRELRGRALDLLRLIDPDAADRLWLEQEARRVGGMRSGVIHATVSSHNGSTGGARNVAGIELEHDVRRAIRASGISGDDVLLLCLVHEDRKPNTRAAVIRVLRDEGLLAPDVPDDKADLLVAEHKKRVAKRLARAAGALKRALRALPKHGLDEKGQAREPDFGHVPLLRAAAADEIERTERDAARDAAESKPGLARCGPEAIGGARRDPSGWS